MPDEVVKPAAKPAEPEHYVVEAHTNGELMGSTITFRVNEIITDPRRLAVARAFNAPLRKLMPITRG